MGKPWIEVVCSSEDGLSALAQLEGCKPDAILADISMPYMTGLELVRAVHTLNPETVCVLLSAYTEFEYAREAIALSVHAYLTKPIDDDEMEKTFKGLKKLLDDRRNRVVHHMVKPDETLLDMQRIWMNAALHGQINGETLCRRAKELKLNLGGEHVCVFIISAESTSEEVLRAIGNVSIQGEDIFTAIFSDNTPTALRKQVDHAALAAASLARARIGVSEAGQLEALGTLYEHAMNAHSDSFYVKPGLTVIYGQHKRGVVRLPAESLKHFDGELEAAALEGDDAAASNVILHLFASFASLAPQRVEDVIIFCLRLLLGADGACCRALHMESYPEDELYRALHAQRHIDELCAYTLSFVEALMERMNRKLREQRSDQVFHALAYIRQNIHTHISLTEVAAHVHLNASYLSRVFKKIMGVSMNWYINDLKISEAKKLLMTSMSVQQISYKLGFVEYRYFSALFKKHAGLTPIEYRKKRFMP